MAGLPFDPQDPSTYEQSGLPLPGSAPASVGASPISRVATPQPTQGAPYDFRAAGEAAAQRAIERRANVGPVQRFLLKGAGRDPDIESAQIARGVEQQRLGTAATQTDIASKQAVLTEGLLNTLKSSQAFLDSLKPDQREQFATLFAGPLAGLGRLAAGDGHPGHEYMTEDFAHQLLMQPGAAAAFVRSQQLLHAPGTPEWDNENRLIADAYNKGGFAAGQQAANNIASKNLLPYLQYIENNLSKHADAIRAQPGFKGAGPNGELTQEQFKTEAEKLVAGADPKDQPFYRYALTSYLNDEKNAGSLANAHIYTNKTAEAAQLEQGKIRTQPYTRGDVEKQVDLENTTPGNPFFGKTPRGSLAWQQRYNDLARQVVIQAGGAIRGAGTGLTPETPNAPPPGTPPAATKPPVAALPAGTLATREFQPPAAEIQKHGDTLAYIKRVEQLADDLDEWRKGRSTGDLARIQAQIQSSTLPGVGGYAKIAFPLDKDSAALNANMAQLTTEWEQAKGGVRAVAQQAAQGRLANIHGGTIANPNASINLRELAKGMRENLIQENATATGVNQKPLKAPAPLMSRGTQADRDRRALEKFGVK